MLKSLLLASMVVAAYGLDNAIRFTATETQTGRPFDLHRVFANGEICGYPQPFVNGSSLATWGTEVTTRWPATSSCPAGPVKAAGIYFQSDVTNTTTYVIDFRDNANPCSSGNQTACNAAAMDGAAILAHDGGTWTGYITATAEPQGASTSRVTNVRTMITAGEFTYLHRSAAATKILVRDISTSLGRDFGWTQRRLVAPDQYTEYSINSTATSRAAFDASHWSGIATPFEIVIDSEILSVCYVSTARVYFGLGAGVDASCANVNGRGIAGSSAAAHAGGLLALREATWLTGSIGSGNTTLPVNSGGVFSTPTVVQVLGEKIRICNISGNNLTVGTGSTGCPANGNGRSYVGTNTVQTGVTNSPIFTWTGATDIWVDAPTAYRALHPVFVITVYPGFASVGIEMMLFNSWTGKQQDQEYNLSVSKSDNTDSLGVQIRHIPGTAWKYPDGPKVGICSSDWCDRKWWDGIRPAAGRFDYNLSYLRYSGMLTYDDSIAITQGAVDNALSVNQPHSNGTTPAWNNGTQGTIEDAVSITADRENCAYTFKGMGAGGTRWDIGVNPTWNVLGLYAMSRTDLTGAERWMEWTLGSAGCAASFPYIWLESDTNSSLKFCNSGESTASPTAKSCTGANQTVAAFGYPVSIDARPGLNYYPDVNATYTYFPVGPVTYNLWTTNDVASHMPEMFFVPWLLTGDWYYQQGMAARGGWILWAANGYPNWNSGETQPYINKQFRKGAWGLTGPIGAGGGPRNMAWGWNILHNGMFAQSDGTPTKEYLMKKVETNLAAWEGKFGITTGNYYQPCLTTCADDYSYWLFGRRRQGNNIDMSLFSLADAWGGGANNDSPTLIDSTNTRAMISYWGEQYFIWAITDSYNKGLTQAGPVRNAIYNTFHQMVKNPSVPVPWMISAYRSPGNPCPPVGCASYPNAQGVNFLFTSWSDWFNLGWTTLGKTTYYSQLDSPNDPLGRAWMSTQVARLGSDVANGPWVANWMNAALTYQGTKTTQPSWWSAPNSQYQVPNYRVVGTPGATTATLRFTRPTTTATCDYLVYTGTGLPPSTLQSAEPTVTNAAGGREIELPLTGLTTATAYGVRVTCSSARGYINFSTN